MTLVEKSIEVNVPATVAYNQWTQFEEFPQFMKGVKQVTQEDDRHLYWRADIMGVEQQWRAEITEQIPDQRIAWRSISGARNAGVVTFHHIGPEVSRVTLQMEYEPEGVVESIGDLLGFVTSWVESNLQRFKAFIESRETATGAWRGEIERES
jgi:uncharacterized membrane protein